MSYVILVLGDRVGDRVRRVDLGGARGNAGGKRVSERKRTSEPPRVATAAPLYRCVSLSPLTPGRSSIPPAAPAETPSRAAPALPLRGVEPRETSKVVRGVVDAVVHERQPAALVDGLEHLHELDVAPIPCRRVQPALLRRDREQTPELRGEEVVVVVDRVPGRSSPRGLRPWSRRRGSWARLISRRDHTCMPAVAAGQHASTGLLGPSSRQSRRHLRWLLGARRDPAR